MRCSSVFRSSSRAGEPEHEQDARLLRGQVVGGHRGVRVRGAERRDPPAPDPRAVGDDDTGPRRLVQRVELGRRHEARSESGRDDPLRAGVHARAHRGAVRAGPGVDDVDPGQGVESARVELGIRGAPAQRRAVEHDAVGVRVPERPEVRAAEGLQAQRGGLGAFARGLDLVVQHDHDAHPPRAGRAGGPHPVHDVERAVAGHRGRGPLRSDEHHRDLHLQSEVEEVRGLLEGGGAVGDHDAVEVGTFGDEGVNLRREREPVARPDGMALQHVVRDRRHVRDLRKLGGACQQLLDREHLLAVDVAHELEPVRTDRGDGSAGADHRDGGLARSVHARFPPGRACSVRAAVHGGRCTGRHATRRPAAVADSRPPRAAMIAVAHDMGGSRS